MREGDGPMREERGAAFTTTLGAGLLLGLAADRLLWAGPLGPGLVLWMALLGGAAVLLARRQGWEWTRAVAGWSAVAVLAVAGTVWRASPELTVLYLGTAVVAASGALLAARGRRLGHTRVLDHVYGLVLVPWHAVTGTASLLARATLPGRWGGPRTVAVGRGVLLAILPVLVFGLLFASADPVFERAVGLLIPDWELLPPHLFLVGFFGWVSAGLLAGLFPGRRENPLMAVRPPRLGLEETATVLALVAAVFMAFVVIQFSYFFGGASAIEGASGLTLAEYARRGFFELLAVAGLVTVLLLAADAVAPEGPGRRVFRVLAGVLVGLVMLVIASAVLRLQLYIAEFGLTTARLYAAAAMAWIGVSLLLFAATVLRERPRRFASGVLVAALAAVAVLTVLNPDALVARTNVDRAPVASVDGAYLAGLSADAAPVLVAGLDEVDPEARCSMARALIDRWGPESVSDESRDWRRWNAAAARARGLVQASLPELRATGAACG